MKSGVAGASCKIEVEASNKHFSILLLQLIGLLTRLAIAKWLASPRRLKVGSPRSPNVEPVGPRKQSYSQNSTEDHSWGQNLHFDLIWIKCCWECFEKFDVVSAVGLKIWLEGANWREIDVKNFTNCQICQKVEKPKQQREELRARNIESGSFINRVGR